MDENKQRAEFEAAINARRTLPRDLDFTLTKSPSGRDEYVNSHLESCWHGWQAARATQPAVDGLDLKAIAKQVYDEVVAESVSDPDAKENHDFHAGKLGGIARMKEAIERATPPEPARAQKGEPVAMCLVQHAPGNEWTEVSADRFDKFVQGGFVTRTLYTRDALDGVRAAVEGYYQDLSDRKHGAVAESRAFDKIEAALGMNYDDWRAARASAAKEGE